MLNTSRAYGGMTMPEHSAGLDFADAIPGRGGPVALTIAGTIGGWQEARAVAGE